MEKTIFINQNEYKIIKPLGKGKGGYSYLAERGGTLFCAKQIHHEPCDYYQFGNKIEAESNDYKRLCAAGIQIPKLIEIDFERERLAKEFIDGKTIYEMVKDGQGVSAFLPQVREMARKAKSAGLNIDYFPTNFVAQNGTLFYVDYECNDYSDKWNFENWGIKYWSRTEKFVQYTNERGAGAEEKSLGTKE